MFELQHFITDIIGSLQITDVLHFLIPQAGVGGGVEAREYVELLPLIKSTLIFLVGVGTVFGIGLALTAKRFAVQVDPRVEKVLDVLAHAH
jgi:Na+-translocating ferredoxin:NAD+ oxidoreductase subunit B